MSRYVTVQKTLVKDVDTLFSYEETPDKGQMYGLLTMDLTQIKPNYDAMVKGGTLRISDDGYAQGEQTPQPEIFLNRISFHFFFQNTEEE